MTPDVSYTPPRKGKKPEAILTISFAALLVCAFLISFCPWGRLFWQGLFLVAAIVIVAVYSRYLASSFTYTVSCETGVFLVVQKKGRRLCTLCRMDLRALYRIRLFEAQDALDAGRCDRYSYCMNPSPEISYLMFFHDGERTATVRVEVDAAFLALLEEIVAANALRTSEDGETDEY